MSIPNGTEVWNLAHAAERLRVPVDELAALLAGRPDLAAAATLDGAGWRVTAAGAELIRAALRTRAKGDGRTRRVIR